MSEGMPCEALKPNGERCAKVIGTMMTDLGPRCFTHLQRTKRQEDPSSRPPVRNPKTPQDVQRLVAWALGRAASSQMSPPAANAVSNLAKALLRTHADKSSQTISAVLRLANEVLKLSATYTVADAQRPAYDAAKRRLLVAMDALEELNPTRESAADEDARARRLRNRDAWQQIDDLDDDAGDGALEQDDAS